VIPRELRKAGAQVEVVEAYETVIPKIVTYPPARRAQEPKQTSGGVITFTSSSTAKNFVRLLGAAPPGKKRDRRNWKASPWHPSVL